MTYKVDGRLNNVMSGLNVVLYYRQRIQAAIGHDYRRNCPVFRVCIKFEAWNQYHVVLRNAHSILIINMQLFPVGYKIIETWFRFRFDWNRKWRPQNEGSRSAWLTQHVLAYCSKFDLGMQSGCRCRDAIPHLNTQGRMRLGNRNGDTYRDRSRFLRDRHVEHPTTLARLSYW